MHTPGAAIVTIAALAAATPSLVSAEAIHPGDPMGLSLGLFGHSTPDILKHAKTDPYAAPPAGGCDPIQREIAELDDVLGPDADAPTERTKMVVRGERLLGRAMRSAIPHRDIVRFVTGADRKDKAANDAAMAGWARRGFLRGLEVNMGCGSQEVAAEAASGAAVNTAAEAAPVALAPIPPASPGVTLVPVPTAVPAAAPEAPQNHANHGLLHTIADVSKGFVR